jgi:hypothetical protein
MNFYFFYHYGCLSLVVHNGLTESFLMNFYVFCHYATSLSLVAAQWLDGVSLVPLFVIIRPCVLFTGARIFSYSQ